jgi:CrcB protein
MKDDTAEAEEDELVDPDAPVRERRGDRHWEVTVVIAAGGVLGAEARYGLSMSWPHEASGFPWATAVTNVAGCFGIGILMTLLAQLTAPHRLVRPFVGIGVLGGFTTFSTFAVDAERLIGAHRLVLAAAYVAGTVVAAGLAVAAGTICTQLGLRARRRRHEPRRGRQASEPTRGRP